jgi:RimJ/RimL family protein N-acetyltransferase
VRAGSAPSDVWDGSGVRIEPWGNGDLPLLEKLMGDPEMTEHLGGPESDEKLAERQARYERLADSRKGRMIKIADGASSEAVGSVGYWERTWRGEVVYEMGWSVLPAFQGRGIAGFEFPPGNFAPSNDWRLDLFASG